MAQQRLNGPDIGVVLEEMSGEAMPQRMQRHPLLDPRSVGCFMEQAVEMAGGDRLAGSLSAGKEPTFRQGYSRIVTRGTRLPPLPQQVEHLVRQHHIAILAALGLLDANDVLRPVDVLDLEPHDLARPQSAAVAEAEQNARLEACGHRQQSLDLVDAHHQRELLRLTNVVDLLGKVQSPQRDAKQEPQPGHDAVAGANAHARLGQVQLEPADILQGGCIRRPLQKRGKPLAGANVASLRSRAELACIHVFDHTLTQRGGSNGCHEQLLSWMRLVTLPSSRQGASPATRHLSAGITAQDEPHLATIAKRFRAMCRFSAAGEDDLYARFDDRRLKSAKARNRVGK